MQDPAFDELLADAESVLSEFGMSNTQAVDRVLGEEGIDLETDREHLLRVALIEELDRRYGSTPADTEELSRAEEEWSDRGDTAGEDRAD